MKLRIHELNYNSWMHEPDFSSGEPACFFREPYTDHTFGNGNEWWADANALLSEEAFVSTYPASPLPGRSCLCLYYGSRKNQVGNAECLAAMCN